MGAPSPKVYERRQKWVDAFDPRRPLADQLDWPYVQPWQVAHLMGVTEQTVYDSMGKHIALTKLGEHDAALLEVPCIPVGKTGRSKRIPTGRFLAWWEGRFRSHDSERVAS